MLQHSNVISCHAALSIAILYMCCRFELVKENAAVEGVCRDCTRWLSRVEPKLPRVIHPGVRRLLLPEWLRRCVGVVDIATHLAMALIRC